MALRSAIVQLADSVGILGLNRSCWGASTSSSTQQQAYGLGFRLLRTLVAGETHEVLQPCQDTVTLANTQHENLGPFRSLGDGSFGSISVRGYKSNKRSLKPFNTAASWQAVQPLLVEQRQQQELQGGGRAPARRWRPRLGPVVDTCLPPIPEVPVPAEYTRVGVITGQYSLKPERVFAVVQLAGTQFKVTTDDIIFVNQLPGVEVNDVIALDRVMLLGSRAQTVVGRPYVPGGVVLAAVEEHFRDGKVHVFKKKKRKRYRKYQAPRPNLTTLRILQVRGIEPAPGDELALPTELPIAVTNGRYEGLLGLPATSEGDSEEAQPAQQEAVAGAQ